MFFSYLPMPESGESSLRRGMEASEMMVETGGSGGAGSPKNVP